MGLVGLVLGLIIVGLLLGALNRYGGPYMQPWILTVINVVVVVAVILYLLSAFGILDAVNIPVPRLR